eukprot:scaffold303449_cov39-Prasinocladus_malaysianus.AAC.1
MLLDRQGGNSSKAQAGEARHAQRHNTSFHSALAAFDDVASYDARCMCCRKLERLPVDLPVMKEPSEVDVEGFVKANLTAYDGDSSFLAGATDKTKALFAHVQKLQAAEIAAGGVLDVDPSAPCGMTAFPAGYIDEQLDDVIVGLQTDKPLKRDIHPKGGINMVNAALKAYGFEEDPEVRLSARQRL